SEIYLESYFLSLIQAIETFCRTVYGGAYVSRDSYKRVESALVAAIPTDLPDDFRRSLRERIRYGYEYSLRKRLRDVLNGMENETINLVCPDARTFADKIVNTRNYLTHYSNEIREKAILGT